MDATPAGEQVRRDRSGRLATKVAVRGGSGITRLRAELNEFIAGVARTLPRKSRNCAPPSGQGDGRAAASHGQPNSGELRGGRVAQLEA
jgi:hypothetical protein